VNRRIVGSAPSTARAALACLGLAALLASGARDVGASNPKPDTKSKKSARYLFASIPWLTAGDSLAEALGARGYKPVPGGTQKDRRQFEGRLFERWTMITALLDDRARVVRWDISIPAPQQAGRDPYLAQRPVYDDAVVEMEGKYGRRRWYSDQFRFPYNKGDGREARALEEEKAKIRSEWVAGSGDRMLLALDQRVSLTLVYESPEWAAAEKERRKRKAQDL